MKALFICEKLLEYLAKERIIHGHLHSVFKSACNIETREGLITLLKMDRIMSPMSLMLDMAESEDFIELGLKRDYCFHLDVNGLRCIEIPFNIQFKDVKPWYSGVIIKPSQLTENQVLDNIRRLEAALLIYNRSYEFQYLIHLLEFSFKDLNLAAFNTKESKEFEFIYDRFTDFLKAAAIADIGSIADKAKRIIGFGPGLTPAIDDFINGFMIALIYFGNFFRLDMRKINAFNTSIVSKGLGRTTKVSSEMLKHGASGRANEAVRELMLSMLYEKEEERLVSALIRTISFGETSGSDTALGIYMAGKLLTNLRYRRVWESEAVCGY